MTERVIDVVPGLVRGHKRDVRCIYDRRVKQELVRRCQQPGVSVAAMALAHGLNANLLRKWITVVASRRGPAQSVAAVLLPVRAERTESAAIAAPVPANGYIEIVLADGTLRLHGRVTAEMLAGRVDDEIVHAIRYLADPKASYTTGVILQLNGGTLSIG